MSDREPPGGGREAAAPDDVAGRLAAAMERIGEATRRLLRGVAAGEGLSVLQAQVLSRLHAAAEPEQHQGGALARWLDVSPPTISDALAALERKGLVERSADAADARRLRVSLTPAGTAVAERIAAWDAPLRAALEVGTGATVPAATPMAAMLDQALRTITALQRAGVVTVARTCHGCRFFDPAGRPGSPYWCDLLDAPLAPPTLRLDCPEHEPEGATGGAARSRNPPRS